MSALAGPLHVAAVVLVLSGAQKLVDPRPPSQAMRDAGLPLPVRLDTLAGRVLGALEMATGLAVLATPWAAAAAWLGAFYLLLAGFVLLLRRRDESAGCGCFGASSAPPTLVHVAVNVAAAAVGVVAATTGVPDVLEVIDEGLGVAIPYAALVVTGASLILLGPSLFADLVDATRAPSDPTVRTFGPTPGATR